MAEHLVLYVDRLLTPSTFDSANDVNMTLPSSQMENGEKSVNGVSVYKDGKSKKIHGPGKEEGEFVECRICQEEDVDRSMDIPCACTGSMKYAHRKCVQRWCNEKGDTICEICQQAYKPGYTAPAPANANGISIDLSGPWGAQLDLNDPRILAMAAAERHFLEAEYDDYEAANASGAGCCRSVALIFMTLLLLRHALAITTAGGEEDVLTFCTLFLLRAAGFLLPCYIMARAMNILQRRRQRQEAATTAAEVAFLLQAGRARGLRFAAAASGSSHVH
uniref:TSA: Wollemia nobilis Ref_Wollemi_Transcript_3702_1026 transcribed RNA sequence n=1 Tax=Wollemia nobilis TaxID=56998 RepID=A0A0C9RQ51_9CONI